MNGNLSSQSVELVLRAGREARSLGHTWVGTEHLFLAAMENGGQAAQILTWLGQDAALWRSLVHLYPRALGTPPGVCGGMTPALRRVLRLGVGEAMRLGAVKAEPEHMLLAAARQHGCTAMELLRVCGRDADAFFTEVYGCLRAQNAAEQRKETEMKLTEQFCEDLVARARNMDPVIGRDRETETVMEILCRKQKCNPALIGEPGVGKTAIVEGLAQRMAAGLVPDRLRGKRLYSLNLASLLAGTKYRGEFEERVRDMVQEIRRSGNIILFIDELHSIVGAGSAEGAIDAANLLKPALSRGDLQVIGATTLEEYRKYIEKDAALERRFRPVTVREPSAEEAERILRALRPGLERHHGLAIGNDAIRAAVELSCRYLTEHFLPDKAVDLLDEGASRAAMRHLFFDGGAWETERKDLSKQLDAAIRAERFEEAETIRTRLQTVMTLSSRRPAVCAEVTARDIAETVSLRTGIPVGKLTATERSRMLELEDALRSRVVGQEAAVRAVAAAIRRSRTGLRDEKRPVATMLFTGPSGVGKTELCKALAETVYGRSDALVRLDMSEYMERHAVSRLLGAPPGYVGHGEGGLLTEKVRKMPYCVVLLDEIEKAHRDVCGILLQIMDDGRLTDSVGRKVDFRNTIVIMTSNLGTRSVSVGFEKSASVGRDSACLKEWFSPEFMGRVDCVAAFRPLEKATLASVAAMQLKALSVRTEKAGIHIETAEELCAYLASRCGSDGGARQLRRLMQEEVETPLAELLLSQPEVGGVALRVTERGISAQPLTADAVK